MGLGEAPCVFQYRVGMELHNRTGSSALHGALSVPHRPDLEHQGGWTAQVESGASGPELPGDDPYVTSSGSPTTCPVQQ
jgi:hypothetical protein